MKKPAKKNLESGRTGKSIDVPPKTLSESGGVLVEMARGGEAARAILGKDNFLFLSNDSNRLFDQHVGKIRLSRKTMRMIADTHFERHELLRSWDATYRHIIIPNKETVLADYLPEGLEYGKFRLPPVLRYLEAMEDVRLFTDFEPFYLRQFPADVVFRRNDTHWTAHGAHLYIAYIFSRHPELQSLVQYLIAPMQQRVEQSLGDLSSKLPGQIPQDQIMLRPIVDNSTLVYSNGLPNRAKVRLYRNPKAFDSRRIVLAHDSFADRLATILPSIFSTVLLVHTPNFDSGLIRVLRPDIYLSAEVERFFVRPPVNDQNTTAYVNSIADKRNLAVCTDDMEQHLLEAFT